MFILVVFVALAFLFPIGMAISESMKKKAEIDRKNAELNKYHVGDWIKGEVDADGGYITGPYEVTRVQYGRVDNWESIEPALWGKPAPYDTGMREEKIHVFDTADTKWYFLSDEEIKRYKDNALYARIRREQKEEEMRRIMEEHERQKQQEIAAYKASHPD